jgi:hypothetical protein
MYKKRSTRDVVKGVDGGWARLIPGARVKGGVTGGVVKGGGLGLGQAHEGPGPTAAAEGWGWRCLCAQGRHDGTGQGGEVCQCAYRAILREGAGCRGPALLQHKLHAVLLLHCEGCVATAAAAVAATAAVTSYPQGWCAPRLLLPAGCEASAASA